ncbi:hypothetical protein QS257_17990 [Terrilactibacillus sp. S3-3]|nr:hypothetical protein QS257_17990 [Terrilactibacillus sp. S3-3]
MYARGAIDDKGPTMAAFYGLKAVKSRIPASLLSIAFGL